MYKDPDKQREANRKAKQKQRQGMTCQPLENAINSIQGMTNQGMTHKEAVGMTEEIKQIEKDLVDMGITPKSAKPERTALGNIRVSKPGDPDYEPQCETTRVFVAPTTPETLDVDIETAKQLRQLVPKRGKAIKCFEDLPPDVQETIHRLSTIGGKIDHASKAKRTKAAIKYQHLFPDRYHSTGCAGTPNLDQVQTVDMGEMR